MNKKTVWCVAPLLVLVGVARAQHLCPDGTYVSGDPVFGTCQITPDGSYVAGPDSRESDRSFARPQRGAGGFAAGFQQGVEKARQRRIQEEELRRKRELEELQIERERFELEQARARAEQQHQLEQERLELERAKLELEHQRAALEAERAADERSKSGSREASDAPPGHIEILRSRPVSSATATVPQQ